MALAPASMLGALLIIVANQGLDWPQIYTSMAVGTVPTIAIFIAVQVKANDYRAFKKAKPIK
ncbi:MAG: hypothetical protein RLZZ65_1573 [Bacteroidota bacterium]